MRKHRLTVDEIAISLIMESTSEIAVVLVIKTQRSLPCGEHLQDEGVFFKWRARATVSSGSIYG